MKKKKIIAIIIAAVMIFAAAYMIISGFTTKSGVFISEYSLSDDGSELTFTAAVASSIGYVRGYEDEYSDGAHHLKFYSTWGGLNSSLGAKSEYTLALAPEDDKIYILDTSSGEYRLVLTRDAESGEWTRGTTK